MLSAGSVKLLVGKGHAQILVEAREGLDLVIAAIARDTSAQCVQRQMIHDLCEDEFANVHAFLPNMRDGSTLGWIRHSNR